MGIIAETTDRVAVLYAGRMVEIGRTNDVIKNPRHPYTQGLMASTPNIDKVSFNTVLPQIEGNMPGLANLPTGCRFHPRCKNVLSICKDVTPKFHNGVSCHLFSDNGSAK